MGDDAREEGVVYAIGGGGTEGVGDRHPGTADQALELRKGGGVHRWGGWMGKAERRAKEINERKQISKA